LIPDCGLTEGEIETIIAVLIRHAEVEEAFVFGSRAKGSYRPGSDVDLALKGTAVSHEVIVSISSELNEETNMPYKFDVVNLLTIENPDLVGHINRVGVRVYPLRPVR
jgi:uncharacterized protein